MTELWVATSNSGKLREFKALFADRDVQVRGVNELGAYHPPPETGATFTDNARIKARALKAVKPGVWVVADDSGLEVEGLNGLPGVHSARYAGERASDAENVAKLLKMVQIRTPANRAAQFRCVLVAFDPAGTEHICEGVIKGRLATAAKGQGGFGYDPVFIADGHQQTFAEMTAAMKNQISHRALALRELLKQFS